MKNAEEFGERSQQRSHHRSLHQYRMKNVEEFGERSHTICDRSHMQQTLVSPRVRTIADRSQPIVRFIRNLLHYVVEELHSEQGQRRAKLLIRCFGQFKQLFKNKERDMILEPKKVPVEKG
jgi:hypothetical protein